MTDDPRQSVLFPLPDVPPLREVLPLFRFVGGKRWLAPWLRRGVWLKLLKRPGLRLIEPFAGGMAVSLSIGWPDTIAGDLAAGLIDLYREVQADPQAVAGALWCVLGDYPRVWDQRHAPGRGYYGARAEYNRGVRNGMPGARRAALLLRLTRTAFNGLFRVNRAGCWNVPVGHDRGELISPAWPTLDELESWAAVARGWRFVCSDFESLIDDARAGDAIFADPPYVDPPEGDGVRVFTAYLPGSFRPVDQARLADALVRARARGAVVVHTNRDSPPIRDLYGSRGFTILPTAELRAVSRDAGTRHRRPCLLVLSHPEVVA